MPVYGREPVEYEYGRYVGVPLAGYCGAAGVLSAGMFGFGWSGVSGVSGVSGSAGLV
ncbi:hypothetical protein PG1511B_0204 [Bifidobacterium pseudolongum subsp. globosum]|nr:hypothetical protein PG1511B_0204 [Bifidobacterium pseudolongum subsp. globosum]